VEAEKCSLAQDIAGLQQELARLQSLLDNSDSSAAQQQRRMLEKCAIHLANRSARLGFLFIFRGWKHETHAQRRCVSVCALMSNERRSLESVELLLVLTSWLCAAHEGCRRHLQVQLEEEVRKSKSLQRAEEESAQLETQVSELECKLRTADAELQEAQELNRMLRQEIVQDEDEYENRCQELFVRLAATEDELQKARQRAETAERELAQKKYGVTVANAQATVAETQLDDLKRVLAEKRDLLRQNEEERHELIEELSMFKQRTADAERAVQEHSRRADAADAQARQTAQLGESSRASMLREMNALQESLLAVEEDLALTRNSWARAKSSIEDKFKEFIVHMSNSRGELEMKVKTLEADLTRKDDEVALENERAENLLRELRVEEQVGDHQEAQIVALEDEVRGLRDKIKLLDWQDWSIRLICRYERQTLIGAIDALEDERKADQGLLDERFQQLVQETQKHDRAESALQEQKREAESMCVYITDLQSSISSLRAQLAECSEQQAEEDKDSTRLHMIMLGIATKRWTSASLSHAWGMWQHDTCLARRGKQETERSANDKSISVIGEIAKLVDTLDTQVCDLHKSFRHMQQNVQEKMHERISRMGQALQTLARQLAQETESFNAQRREMSDVLRDLRDTKEDECRTLRQDAQRQEARANKAEAELSNMARQHGSVPSAKLSPRGLPFAMLSPRGLETSIVPIVPVSPRGSIQDSELRKQVSRERERAEKAEAELSRSNELREALANKMAAADERWEQERAQLRRRIEELSQERSQGQVPTNILADLESKRSNLETELQRCASRIQEASAEGKKYKKDAETAQIRSQELQALVRSKEKDLQRAQEKMLKVQADADTRIACEMGRFGENMARMTAKKLISSLISRVWDCWARKKRNRAVSERTRAWWKNRVIAKVWRCWEVHHLELMRMRKLENRALRKVKCLQMAKSMCEWIELRDRRRSCSTDPSAIDKKHAAELLSLTSKHDKESSEYEAQIAKLKRQRQLLIDAVSPVLVTLTLGMDFSAAGEEGSQERNTFETLVKQDLANASGVEVDSIEITRLSRGSVVVDIELQQDPSEATPDPLTAALELQRQVHDPTSALHRGVVTSMASNIHVPDKVHLHRIYSLASQRHKEAKDELALMRESLDALQSENQQIKMSLQAAQDECKKRVDMAEFLQSALATETSAKDIAKSKEMEQLLSAKTAARAATDDKVSALEKEVAVAQSELEDASKALEKKVATVQSELEDARKAAEGTRALLGGESALMSEALEKARAQGITLAQERDALASEVESLKQAVAALAAKEERSAEDPVALAALEEVHAAEVAQLQQMAETAAADRESQGLHDVQFNEIVALAGKHEATIAALKEDHYAAVAALEEENSQILMSLQAENRHLSAALESTEEQCRNLRKALQQQNPKTKLLCRIMSLGSPRRSENEILSVSSDILTQHVEFSAQSFRTEREQQVAAHSKAFDNAPEQIADTQSEPREKLRQLEDTDAILAEDTSVHLNTTTNDVIAINLCHELTVLKAETCAYRVIIKDSVQALNRELVALTHASQAAQEETFRVFDELQMDFMSKAQAIEQEVEKQRLRAEKAETGLQNNAQDRLSLSEWGQVQRQMQDEISVLQDEKKALLLEKIRMSMLLNQMETSKSTLEAKLGMQEQQYNAMANYVEQDKVRLHEVEQQRDALLNDLRWQLSDAVSKGKSLDQEASHLRTQLQDVQKFLDDEAHGKIYYQTCYAKVQMELDDLYMQHATLERRLKQMEVEVSLKMHKAIASAHKSICACLCEH